VLERYKEIIKEWEMDNGKNIKSKPKLVRIKLENEWNN